MRIRPAFIREVPNNLKELPVKIREIFDNQTGLHRGLVKSFEKLPVKIDEILTML